MNSDIPRLGWRWPQRWLEAGLTLIFPPRCAGCGLAGEYWCAECNRSVRKITGRLCSQCGFPLRSRSICLTCKNYLIPMIVRSYAWYEGRIARALVHMKYRPNRKLSTLMAGWLAELYLRQAWDVTLVTPVPLSEARLRQRGFNQAALVSMTFASTLGLRHSERALHRVRETKSQVGLDGVARFQNVRGAFQGTPELVHGQKVLVVDDLYTTGATMSACAEALIDAGASGVYGLTIGRAQGKISEA